MPHYVFSALAWDEAATPRRGPTSRGSPQIFQTIQLFIQECECQVVNVDIVVFAKWRGCHLDYCICCFLFI